MEGQFESIAVEVETKNSKHNIIIAEIYRVPNTNEQLSIERYDQMVTALDHTKCDLMIGNDQTFDYVKVDTNQNVSDLLNVFFTHGLCQQLNVQHGSHIQVPQLLTTYMQNSVDR